MKNKKAFDERKTDVVKTVIETLGIQFGILEEKIKIEDINVEIMLFKTNLREK